MIRNLLFWSLGMLILGGCRSQQPIQIEASPSPVSSTPARSTPVPAVKSAGKPAAKAAQPTAKGKTIAINLYQLDSQCNQFETTKATVPANQPVTQAVAQTLEKVNSESLDVAGYRVKVTSGVATIDFRPIPNARKSLTTLANCEQLALFGSVRRTLTQNPVLKIKSVQFTDRGQPIKPQ